MSTPQPASRVSPSRFPRLSPGCQNSLLELAKTLLQIDHAILHEARLDRERYGDYDASKLTTRDLEYRTHLVELFDRFELYLSHGFGKSSNDLFDSLARENLGMYDEIWKGVAVRLLSIQGGKENANSKWWSSSKNRALIFLDLRSEALDIYEPIEEQLEERGYSELARGLRTKFRLLKSFETVYNRQPAHSKAEPLYIRPEPNNKKKNAAAAYRKLESKGDPTLVSIVFITTMLCVIPLFLASRQSTSARGSVQDLDFYLLIQSTIMQVLGLFTAMYPIHRDSSGRSWRWAQAFTVSGALCAVSSIPLYLLAPTIWSAIFSFFESAAQAGMALLLALMIDSGIRGVKLD